MSIPHDAAFGSLVPASKFRLLVRVAFLAGLMLFGRAGILVAVEPCRIEVIEKGTNWPVPLVELRTTNQHRFVTDNAGVIACDAPELLGREVWFDVIGHGYQAAADGFGFRGVRVTPQPGATLRVEVERQNIARRLGRLTGGGIFAESQKLGRELDWKEQGIFGCDSLQLAEHRGRLFWAWGDTTMPNYPLGIFHMSSATTSLTPLSSFEPPLRIRFEYFADDQGRPRGVAQMPGEGPTWLSGYISLRDAKGEPHLVATYQKIRNYLESYEAGLCEWNEATSSFQKVRVLWQKSEKSPTIPPFPDGHPAQWKDAEGREWVDFGNPLPRLRCPATYEAWQDPAQWKVLTPQPTLQSSTGEKVEPHTGHIAWNEFRRKWVTVFMQKGGKPSACGELWCAEAPETTGPWGTAVKVLTHENYTFYNPRLHPELTPAGSSMLMFEGTYTADFADRPQVTPRYNYNQVLYRLDLDDPRLAPAQGK